MSQENPYDDPKRLQQVIASISALSTYKFYKLTYEKAFEKICNSHGNIKDWETIFEQHPEFFRVEPERREVSLVIRRQFPKLWNVDTQSTITREAFRSLSAEQKKRITRKPLKPEQTLALIELAATLNDSALNHKQDQRWWVVHLGNVISLIVGVLVTFAAIYFQGKISGNN